MATSGTSHALIRTSQIGAALLKRLEDNTTDAQELREAVKQGSECVPDGILPPADLKTMGEVFEDIIEDTNVIDAFEPYRFKPTSSYSYRSNVTFYFNATDTPARLGRFSMPGIIPHQDLPLRAMCSRKTVELVKESSYSDSMIGLDLYAPKVDFFTIKYAGLFQICGEFTTRVWPSNVLETPWVIQSYYPPTFTDDADDDWFNYRITLQQFGPASENTTDDTAIIASYVLTEGAFSKIDIVKQIEKVRGFNVIVRVNAFDRFRIVVERSNLIANFPDSNGDPMIPEALFLARSGGGDYNDPYGSTPDQSNHVTITALVIDPSTDDEEEEEGEA